MPLQPLVKWAGGKRSVIPGTLPFFPETTSYTRYVEPFLGGGAFLLHLEPSSALASDSCSELVHLFKAVKDEPIKLMTLLDQYAVEYNRAPREFYLAVREDYNQIMGSQSLEQAARFLFLNKTCFNGLYRVNRHGLFNVPFGGRESAPQLYDRTNLLGISEYLKRGVTIKSSDFRPILAECGEGDFIYNDPPYVHHKGFTSYSANEFSRKDYEEMIELLHEAHKRGAKSVVSNSLDDRELFRGFKKHVIQRSTSVSGYTSARIRSPEYIYCLG